MVCCWQRFVTYRESPLPTVSVRAYLQPEDFSRVLLVLFQWVPWKQSNLQNEVWTEVFVTKIRFFCDIWVQNDRFRRNLSNIMGSTGSVGSAGPLELIFQFAQISLPTDFPFPQTSLGREDFLYKYKYYRLKVLPKIYWTLLRTDDW